MEKIKEAEAFLIERENKFSNVQNGKFPDSFVRGNLI